MFSEIQARLGLDIGPFRKGMMQATGSIAKTGEKLSSLSGKILGPIAAVTALATAFSAAFFRARDLRDEAELMGRTVSAQTARMAEQADDLQALWKGIQDVVGWVSSKIIGLFDYLAEKTQRVLDMTSGLSAEETARNQRIAREAEENARRLERETERRRKAAEDTIRSEMTSAQAARDVENLKKILGIKEEVKEIEQQEQEIIAQIADDGKDAADADRERLRILQEQKMELQAQASAIRARMETERQARAEAAQRERNPFGITSQELAGMNPYDPRFGFSLSARRRIEQAQESVGLSEQARFAEIAGRSGRADDLLSQANRIGSAATAFRTPGGAGSESAEIAKELRASTRHLASIERSLAIMELE